MSNADPRKRPPLPCLPTGVPNLDLILGGGIPELSMTMITGPPGAGKTTLAQQIAFHNASPERPALLFGAYGEPLAKQLRYQQRMAFFDPERIGRDVHFVELGVPGTDLDAVLAAIVGHVERLSPGIVVIDSIRALEDLASSQPGTRRVFLHELAQVLPPWQCTTLLVGEYSAEEVGSGPEFTVADNLLHLTQEAFQSWAMRRLQVVKARGLAHQSGRHAFRITEEGIVVFPRLSPPATGYRRTPGEPRAAFGISGLDEMMHGGVQRGQTCLVAGSSGAGKTLLALHFVVEGARLGEPVVMATFEESPAEHADKMAAFGWDLDDLERRGLLQMVYMRPVDLSIDEVLSAIDVAVSRLGARRMILNSISGLELAVALSGQDELREGLYRLSSYLAARGVTVLLTTEVPGLLGEVQLSHERISFLADNAILLRYVEIAAELRRALTVFKMRTSAHDNSLREYHIGPQGLVVDRALKEYSGVLTGIPTLQAAPVPRPFTAGLEEPDESLMHALLELKQATVSDLARALGLPEHETGRALERLAELGYVMRTQRGDRTTYRVSLLTAGRPDLDRTRG